MKYEVNIPLSGISLPGDVVVPLNAEGLVIFSHGSGSSRLSPRNRFVAEVIHKSHMATLMFDLLTEQEDAVYANRFNIDLLASRLQSATEWAMSQDYLKGLKIGYFGASTGAAAALKAAAILGDVIHAVVSRGGRPDLASESLELVKAPTLLIVGGLDTPVIALNNQAFEHLDCEKEIRIVSGASHLFEEAGKLEEVAGLAAEWYRKHLAEKAPVTA